MANKYFINAFASKGDRTIIPDTIVDDRINYEQGYTPSYSEDPAAGGKYVDRKSFNGVINDVTTAVKFIQESTFPEWIQDRGDNQPYSYGLNAVVNYNGKIYYSSKNKNQDEPTNNASWKAVDFSTRELIPIGSIIPFVGNDAPDDWLICDGRPFVESTYPELAVVLKHLKVGDTFYTPNLTNKYLKGAGDSSKGDLCNFNDGRVGSHTHTASYVIPKHKHDSGSLNITGRYATSGLTRNIIYGVNILEGIFSAMPNVLAQAYGGTELGGGRAIQVDGNAHNRSGWSGFTSEQPDKTYNLTTDADPIKISNEVDNMQVNFIIKAMHIEKKY